MNRFYREGGAKPPTSEYGYINYISNLIDKLDLSEEARNDVSFHLAEVYPDLKELVDGIENKTLSEDRLYDIFSHLPEHIKESHDLLFSLKKK